MKFIFLLIICLINIVNSTNTKALTSSTPTTTSTTSTSTTLTTNQPCRSSIGHAGYKTGMNVNMQRTIYHSAIEYPWCEAANYTMTLWFNGTNPIIPNVATSRAVGTWWREYCNKPCICSAEACYEPRGHGDLILYPYCSSETGCFIALLLNRHAYLVNPNNSSDRHISFSQLNLDTFERKRVTDSSYIKVTKVSCLGCTDV